MLRYALLALLIVALVLTAWTSVTQVESGERGVVLRFGRFVETVGPGLHVGLPWGIDRVERVKVDRFRRVTIGFFGNEADEFGLAIPEGQLLTGDHNLVNVQIVLDYAVDDRDAEAAKRDAEVAKFALYGDAADGLIARTAETILAEWVAGRNVDEVLLRGKEILPRWLVEETNRRIAPYGLGVRIHLASVGDIAPPRQVKDAFDAVNRAQTEILTLENNAKKDVNERWTAALNYANELAKRAPVEAAGVKNIARVEAEAFSKRLAALEQVRTENPDYLSKLWWDEMTKTYAGMRAAGRLDLLDNRLGSNGIDIIQSPLPPKYK